MKVLQILRVGLAVFAGALPATAAEKIRVLVMTGGHGFSAEPFFRIFSENPQIEFTTIAHGKESADGWDRADLSAVDVVVLYDMPKAFTPTQRERMLALFPRGVGLLVLHHALVSVHGWAEYERIIGGIYPTGGSQSNDAPAVGYRHDVDIPVVVNPDHPLTAGLGNFTVHDEIYWGYRVGSDVTPLLTTTNAESGNPIAWCRTEQRSRVVYVQLGHGPTCFENSHYRDVIARSLRWTAQRTAANP